MNSKKCKLTVNAGEHDRSGCPVTVNVPWSYAECQAVRLQDAASKKLIPCQVSKMSDGIALTWLADGLKAGSAQKLVAVATKDAPGKPAVRIDDATGEGKVDVDIHGSLFTSYHYGRKWVRPFLYPVLGPSDVCMTRHWPIVEGVKGEHTDHVHHKSLWVAYGECNNVDNWSEDPGHGWQRHRAFRNLASGDVFGQITAKNDWCANNEKKQFEEIRAMRFYALRGGLRLFDVDVTLRMTEGQVTFRDTKEGGLLSVRVASSMDVRNGGKIQNGYGGINEGETWGKKAPWCDYSGLVNGKSVGIAVFDHPENPRYPTQWHVRDYGLMTANCFAWSHYCPEGRLKGDMTFKKGSTTVWRYRVYVHKGDAVAGKVSNRFLDYISPPKVTLD